MIVVDITIKKRYYRMLTDWIKVWTEKISDEKNSGKIVERK